MKTEMTTQQAIVMYTAIEALANQFDRDNLAKQNQPPPPPPIEFEI